MLFSQNLHGSGQRTLLSLNLLREGRQFLKIPQINCLNLGGTFILQSSMLHGGMQCGQNILHVA